MCLYIAKGARFIERPKISSASYSGLTFHNLQLILPEAMHRAFASVREDYRSMFDDQHLAPVL